MIIKEIKPVLLSSPYGNNQVFGQPKGLRTIALVSVQAGDCIGIGETYSGVYVPELIPSVIEYLKPFFIGKSVESVLKYTPNIPFVSQGLLTSVCSAINIACWDVWGKINKLPIYKLLSSYYRPPSIYLSGGSVIMSPEEIEKDIDYLFNKFPSVNAYKMRIGKRDDDKKRVKVATDKIGYKKLMVDAIVGTLNQWEPNEAGIQLIKILDGIPIWVEEPVHPERINEIKEIIRYANFPFAFGEHYTSMLEFQQVLKNPYIQWIQPDVTHCGGIWKCNQIIMEINRQMKSCALHVWGSGISFLSNLHLATSKVGYLEYPTVQLEATQFIFDSLTIKDGRVQLPSEPGLGVELDLEKLQEKYPFVPKSGYRV